jgi:hypothetical protein
VTRGATAISVDLVVAAIGEAASSFNWVLTATRDTATSRPDEATMVAKVGLATLGGGATRKGKVAAMTVEKMAAGDGIKTQP